MSAEPAAAGSPPVSGLAHGSDFVPVAETLVINQDDLNPIEEDLGEEDTAKVLFLTASASHLGFGEVLERCLAKLNGASYELQSYADTLTGDWERLYLESFAVLVRNDVLSCLGLDEKGSASLRTPILLSPTMVELYRVCCQLPAEPTGMLVQYMNERYCRRDTPPQYPRKPLLGLELHILEWLQDDVISLTSVSRLADGLRHIDRADLANSVSPRVPDGESGYASEPSRAGSLEEREYSNRRGLCLIFNQERFQCNNSSCLLAKMKYHGFRCGTDQDVARLAPLMQSFGCRVMVCHNLDTDTVKSKLSSLAAAEDLKDYDYLVLCFLSHGSTLGKRRDSRDRKASERQELHMYGSDCEPVSVDELAALFGADRCPALADRLKIVLTQLCQGEHYLEPVNVVESDAPLPTDETWSNGARQLSPLADFLWLQSSTPGYMCYRWSGSGSLYVQSLCQVLQERGTSRDIVHCAERAQSRVLETRTSLEDDDGNDVPVVQQPEIKSRKSRPFMFRECPLADRWPVRHIPSQESAVFIA